MSKSSHYSFTIKPAHTGTFTYRVNDPAKPGFSAAHSKPVAISITPKPSSGSGGGSSSSTSCYPRGNCYEPGEYCRSNDQGATGVAGDGEAIQCEDNNGWRWEPR